MQFDSTMTNSTPKFVNKIERQSSPNNSYGKSQRQQRHNSTSSTGSSKGPVKSNPMNNCFTSINGGRPHTYISSNNGRTSMGRSSCSPTFSAPKNIPNRSTPPRSSSTSESSSRGSPTFYAGAKFSEPPSPASLPKPPSHWTGIMMGSCSRAANYSGTAHHMKMLINVQA